MGICSDGCDSGIGEPVGCDVMPTIRLAVFSAVFSGVCISEPGELDVERCVSSVVSPKPGLMC